MTKGLELRDGVVLVFGGSGLVGRAVTAVFATTHTVIAPRRFELDVQDADAVMACVASVKPRLVINCTGRGGHDACEEDPASAWLDNALVPRHIARACAATGAAMAQLSSAAVFDGQKKSPYLETDLPAPLNVYGASKLAGESIARNLSPTTYVFRLPMLYGPPDEDRNSFVARIRHMLCKKNDSLFLSDDEYACPTPALMAAHAMRQVIVSRPPATYHLACDGGDSLFGIGRFMAMTMKHAAVIRAVPAATFARRCLKPLQGCLASGLILSLGDWQEPLARWLSTFQNHNGPPLAPPPFTP